MSPKEGVPSVPVEEIERIAMQISNVLEEEVSPEEIGSFIKEKEIRILVHLPAILDGLHQKVKKS